MRFHAPITAIFSVCLITFGTGTPGTAAIFIDGSNDSGVEDGSWGHPYRLISSGMTLAAAGDTVIVMPGTYEEHIGVDMHDPMGMNSAAVVMKDGVTLTSYAGPDSTLILSWGAAAVYFDSCGEGTRLSGFSLQVEGFGWGSRISIVCYDAAPVVEGNVSLLWYSGIHCRSGSCPLIRENTVIDGGVLLASGSGGTVTDNQIEGGIYVPPTLRRDSRWISKGT